MTGIEVAVGMLIAWVVRKARRAGTRADQIADEAIDVGLARVHEVIVGKLGGDPSLARLEREALDAGQVSDRTRTRVQLALQDAAEDDPKFAQALKQALQQAEDANVSKTVGHITGRGVAVGGEVSGVVSTGDDATINQHR
ncbi:hypothetical protein AB0M80_07655 [Amycolatopsis sp. NPDC051045]|uniref:hypothetical protein n=1 Tax=Amycolatopsis sp. NPDC051045 TaxID=3156922 RepID=UPI0034257286